MNPQRNEARRVGDTAGALTPNNPDTSRLVLLYNLAASSRDMRGSGECLFEFGRFRIDLQDRRLWDGERLVQLTPKLFDTLALLVRERGRLVSKEAFMQSVWGEVFVADTTLAHNISALRKLLGHSEANPIIETVSKKGYRLVVPVREVTAGDAIVAAGVSTVVDGTEGSADTGGPRAEDLNVVVPDPAEPDSISEEQTAPPENLIPSRAPSTRGRIGFAVLVASAVLVAGIYALGLGRSSVAAPTIRSLLVLPLDNMSGDSGQDYLADGLTEGLTTELAKIGSLRIVSRTTAAQFKRERKPLAEIKRTLDVDAVVEGSVMQIGNRVRVTAQLVRLNPESHVWAETYDRDVDDALALQAELTQALAQAIHVTLSAEDRARLARRRQVRPDAYEAYLRARYYESGAAGLATERAIETYKKAVSLDPTFTAARAGLARAYIFGVGMQPKVALATARAIALEAVRLDPEAPEARLASAITRLYYERDFVGAEQEFRRALDSDPGNADAHFYYSQCLTALGRFEDALRAARRAQQLDPLSPLVAHYVGRIHYFARQYTEAIAALKQALDVDENYAFTHIVLASTYERLHQYDRALEHRQAYLAGDGLPPEDVAALGHLARASGYTAALRHWAQEAAVRFDRRGYLTSSELTYLFAEMGDAGEALRWLRRAMDDHTRDLIYINVEPAFDALRSDDRFKDLVRRAIPTS